jgi:cytochrome c551/c552
MVAVGVAAAALFGAVSAARAEPVIYVLPPGPIPPSLLKEPFALGLYVPGAGGQISRGSTIASLVRGKVENALLGGKPGGKPIAELYFGVAPPGAQLPIVYVQLPSSGEHHNTKRYRVAFVGGGYRGILTSESTRIRGLVSVADIAPSLVDLRQGRTPTIRSQRDDDAAADLRDLETRLSRVHKDRGWTLAIVVLALVALALARPRAAVLVGAAAVTTSLLLSWAGATRFWLVVPAMAGLSVVLAIASSWRRLWLPPVVAAFLLVFAILLAADPELNSLAVLGARPDGGGRFYGIGNQVETLLLPPVIAAVAAGGMRWLVPLGVLALVTIGWSKAGADGGGLLVYAAALAVLAVRMRELAFTPRRVVVVGAGVVVLAVALVGVDAALGGSSHVTHAVGTGPGSLLGDLGHRLHLSWKSATKSAYTILLFLASAAVLVLMATMRSRRPTVDAMLVAVALSLLVNDTPVDVIGLGAIGCAALLRWESVDSRPMRRGALTAASVVAVLALAGCGSEGTTQPVAQTVVGTIQQEAPGKAIFVNQGCGACHTYGPAGPDANGKIGPDLDKLATYAKQAKQPLAKFVDESIVDPNKYVGKQCPPSGTAPCPKNVMPQSYKSLPSSDLKALVDFLTKPQG